MATKQRQNQDERSALTRAKLMDGAYRILLTLGHASLRSANISEESGVSRGGLLHHYPSKEDLVAAVYKRIFDEMEEDTRNSLKSVPDDQLLSALAKAAKRRFFSDSYRVLLDILVASGTEAPVLEVRQSYCSPHYKTARSAWAERIAETGVNPKDASIVTQFLWGTVKGAAIRSLVQKEKRIEMQIIASALELAEQYCAECRGKSLTSAVA